MRYNGDEYNYKKTKEKCKMDKYYTASTAMVVCTMIIMLISVKFNIGLVKTRRQVSAVLFGLIIVGAVCEWSGNMLNGTGTSLVWLHILVKTIELSVAPFLNGKK